MTNALVGVDAIELGMVEREPLNRNTAIVYPGAWAAIRTGDRRPEVFATIFD